jgi:3-hydroxybutyryl-CoA dehydrogenase
MTDQDSVAGFDPARPVGIVGAGVMGTKVAWACARSGLATRLFDVEPGKAAASAAAASEWGTDEERRRVRSHLVVVETLDDAMAGAQLGFENVPERLELKREVHAAMSARLPANACLGSNASSLTCTPMAEASGRPDRFFNLNWTDPRSMRLVELMTSPATAPATADFARAWARHVGMVVVETRKEQLGYAFNRLWRVIKKECLRQIAGGYATAEDLDKAWMLAFGTPYGPCGLMDEVGLGSVLAIEKVYFADSDDESDRPPAFLAEMVARGELGVQSGRGFYRYPGPAYREPGFLDP